MLASNVILMNRHKGFTLVELIVGMLVLAIAMTLFLSLMVPQAIKSVEPIFQVRAAELGLSLISEIASKSFDENSSRTGGLVRCNELNPVTSLTTGCSVIDGTNIEEGLGNRQLFDDVDDYNGLIVSGGNIRNSLNQTMTTGGATPYNLYEGFTAQVSVSYDAGMDGGIPDTAVGNIKLITVTVTTPNNEDIVFSTYRANY